MQTLSLNQRSKRSAQVPRARTMAHPGSFNPVRMQSCSAQTGRHLRLLLQPGRNLFDAIIDSLQAHGIRNASMTLLGGFFDKLQYCTAPPDPSHKTLIAYTAPICTEHSTLVFGNATVGQNEKGKPLVHCHAVVSTAAGTLAGGHIITQQTVIGPQPISVLALALEGFKLQATYDAETHMSLLQPTPGESHA
ncbi:PPC domain-containing DNA-binding protein [Comamonas sp. J-3]|uniref:PPC domain-containing DNA-binding protein n=1 Tax=Comamonas trifloxystrobinivorans TaxID=3350256 RepID=UPI00372A3682